MGRSGCYRLILFGCTTGKQYQSREEAGKAGEVRGFFHRGGFVFETGEKLYSRLLDFFLLISTCVTKSAKLGLTTRISCLPSARRSRFSGGLTPLESPSTRIVPHGLMLR